MKASRHFLSVKCILSINKLFPRNMARFEWQTASPKSYQKEIKIRGRHWKLARSSCDSKRLKLVKCSSRNQPPRYCKLDQYLDISWIASSSNFWTKWFWMPFFGICIDEFLGTPVAPPADARNRPLPLPNAPPETPKNSGNFQNQNMKSWKNRKKSCEIIHSNQLLMIYSVISIFRAILSDFKDICLLAVLWTVHFSCRFYDFVQN